MKIELKKIKVINEMSRETLCFSADVYVDGKKVAEVENRGEGGSNYIYGVAGASKELIKELEDYRNEAIIMSLVEEYDIIKRNQTKAFVIKKGEDIFISKLRHSFAVLKKLSDYSVWINEKITAYEKDGYEVLNTNI